MFIRYKMKRVCIIYKQNRVTNEIKFKISQTIKGWITRHVSGAWRGNTIGYLVVEGMYIFVTLRVRQYTVKQFCFNCNKFTHFMIRPPAQTFPISPSNSHIFILTISYPIDVIPFTHTPLNLHTQIGSTCLSPTVPSYVIVLSRPFT